MKSNNPSWFKHGGRCERGRHFTQIKMLWVHIQDVVLSSLLHTEKLQSFNESLPTAALKLYPPSAPCPTTDRCPERAYTTMVSDIRVTCPNNDVAQRAAGKLQPRSLCSGDILPRRLCERYSSTSRDSDTAATEATVCDGVMAFSLTTKQI